MTQQLAGERLRLLAWPRAILQLARPPVAAGVSNSSEFRRSPWAPMTRLHSTHAAMRRLPSGTDAQAEAALALIREIRDRVHGAGRRGGWLSGSPEASRLARGAWTRPTPRRSTQSSYSAGPIT
jgi:uncharacterized protein (DUF2236 family)